MPRPARRNGQRVSAFRLSVRLACALTLVLLAACGDDGRRAASLEVYGAVLDRGLRQLNPPERDRPYRVVTVGRDTVNPRLPDEDLRFLYDGERLSPEWLEAVRDYRSQMSAPRRLPDDIRLPLRVAPSYDPDASVWTERQYGMVIFSNVGFDAARQRAVAWMHHHCGDLCGYSRFIGLVRTDEGWETVKRSRTALY